MASAKDLRVIGEKPRPRTLIQAFSADREPERGLLGETIALFPTVRSVQFPSAVVQDEWDLVVTDGGFSGWDDRLYGVGFGSGYFGDLETPISGGARAPSRRPYGYTKATKESRFIIPTLEPHLEALVTSQLVPLAQSRESNPALGTSSPGDISFGPRQPSIQQVRPFLQTVGGSVLAAEITMRTGARRWALPNDLRDPVAWIRAAVSWWHSVDADIFPTDPSWVEATEWMTAEEDKAAEVIAEIRDERERLLADVEARMVLAEEGFARVRDEAATHNRRLLTATSADLVDAVTSAFSRLGFEVENRDEVNPPGDLREDLWITTPDDPDWIAIAEVRSYVRGGQVNDLIRLVGRFVRRFAEEQGREPTRVWYVVNHFVREDPGSRPPVLDTNPNEVKTFGEDGGVVIGTVDLFRVIKSVDRGELSPEEARRELMEATERWPT